MSVTANDAPSFIGRNMLWLFVSQILTWGVSLVLLVATPNKLSKQDFGLLAFTGSFVIFFSFVASLGTSTFISRAVARDPDSLGPHVYNAFAMKVVVVVLLSGVAMGLGVVLDYSSTAMALIAIGLGGMAFNVISEVAVGGLAGISRMARPAAWGVVQVYLTSVLALVALYRHSGVIWFASAALIGSSVPCIANCVNVWTFVRGHTTIDFDLWKRMARGGVPLLILSGLILIYGSIDVPLLEGFTNASTVAKYALAYRWVSVPVFVSTIVVNAFSPSLSAFAHEAGERFATLANQSLRIVIAVGIPTATGIIVVAYDLMALLYTGYGDSATLMRILAIHIPLVTISTVLGAILIAKDRQGRYSIVALIAAICNPPLTILAIKLTIRWCHNGAIGAAIATVLTEVLMVSGAYILRPQGVFDRATKVFALRCLAANVCMAAPLVIFDGLELFIKVAIGAVLYVVASVLFGTFTLTDVRGLATRIRTLRRGPSQPTEETEVMEHVLPEER